MRRHQLRDSRSVSQLRPEPFRLLALCLERAGQIVNLIYPCIHDVGPGAPQLKQSVADFDGRNEAAQLDNGGLDRGHDGRKAEAVSGYVEFSDLAFREALAQHVEVGREQMVVGEVECLELGWWEPEKLLYVCVGVPEAVSIEMEAVQHHQVFDGVSQIVGVAFAHSYGGVAEVEDPERCELRYAVVEGLGVRRARLACEPELSKRRFQSVDNDG